MEVGYCLVTIAGVFVGGFIGYCMGFSVCKYLIAKMGYFLYSEDGDWKIEKIARSNR